MKGTLIEIRDSGQKVTGTVETDDGSVVGVKLSRRCSRYVVGGRVEVRDNYALSID